MANKWSKKILFSLIQGYDDLFMQSGDPDDSLDALLDDDEFDVDGGVAARRKKRHPTGEKQGLSFNHVT